MNIPTVIADGIYAIGPEIDVWDDQKGVVSGDIDGFDLVPHKE